MRLVHNWPDIVKRAWSIRLMIGAGLLSGLEAILAVLNSAELVPLPFWLHLALLILTPFVIAAAFVARLVAQKSMGQSNVD
jgi:cytochrome bd-type quinol oxidase subunit 1